MENFQMRSGAVVMLDALGFRGIWKRYPAHSVIETLQSLASITESEARRIQEAAVREQSNIIEFVQPVFLSDTIVFGVTTKPAEIINASGGLLQELLRVTFNDALLAGEAVRIVAQLTAELIRRAISAEPALTFRGCLSFGSFGMTDRFLIGEAVDEAASLMDFPHAGVVMLAPSSARFPQTEVPSMLSPLFDYALPSKKEKAAQLTKCVAPFTGDEGPSTLEQLIRQFGETFTTTDPKLVDDVIQKKVNTIDFLKAAWEARARGTPEFNRAMLDP